MRPRVRNAVLLLVPLALLHAACTRPPEAPSVPVPRPARTDWQVVREAAQRLALDGRYREADSALLAFERRASDSGSTSDGAFAESRFHRMLLRVDPSNTSSSTDSAIRAIDEYLSAGSGQARYQEALVLRRLVGEIHSLRNTPRPIPVVLGDTALLRQRHEEIDRLRDSLTRTSAELERIRRRLRATRPDEVPPPPG